MLIGSRNGTTKIEAYNVLTAIDEVNEGFQGFRKSYDRLCEFTHPNWSGCLGFYGKIDSENHVLYLGQNLRESDYPYKLCVGILVDVLEEFHQIYNDFADIIPEFSKLCEELLDKN